MPSSDFTDFTNKVTEYTALSKPEVEEWLDGKHTDKAMSQAFGHWSKGDYTKMREALTQYAKPQEDKPKVPA